MHAGTPGFQRPGRQRNAAHALAGGDVGGDGLRDVAPAGGLPGFERPLRPAEAPAHGEIEIARIVGHAFELHGGVMEDVAEDGPQELRLRLAGSAQGSKLIGRVLHLEDGGDFLGDCAGRLAVILRRQVEHLDFLALLPEDAATRLLAERALADQCLQPGRRREVGVPRVIRQGVLHGLDDVRQGIETDHVGGAIGGALRTTDLRTGQRIDFVETEAEGLGVVHDGEDGKDADAVGDEVRRIQRTDDALAETRGQPGFQCVQRAGIGALRADDFNQVHVARRVEEMDAAEARPDIFRQALGQRVHRQAGGIGSDNRVGADVRRDLGVEVVFPVHALGDGLDDEVALGEQRQVFVVIGGVDELELALAGERRRVELLEAVEGLLDDTVLVSFFRRQVEQHDRHVGIGEVRGNLRAHHAGAEHGGLFHDQLFQALLLLVLSCVLGIKRTFEL